MRTGRLLTRYPNRAVVAAVNALAADVAPVTNAAWEQGNVSALV